MKRKISHLETTAFQAPFYTPTVGANSYVIPEEYETVLLDIYTSHTEESEDIHLSQLRDILIDDLKLPNEVVPNEAELKSWTIEKTDILDFEKWLYNGHFWLCLSNHLKDVDMLWDDLWTALGTKGNPEEIRKKVLHLTDVKKLIDIGKLDANSVEMLQTVSEGKLYVTYVDFFRLLGRLGAFD